VLAHSFSRSCWVALVALALAGWCGAAAVAETVTLDEPSTDVRVREVVTDVRTTGKVYTNAGNGTTNSHDLSAMASFRYRERRLPPGGREFQSLRALREFELATMQTRVAGQDSGVDLPPEQRLIVARGDRAGVQSYSPGVSMQRETVDLLEIPGDPLVLTALLPRGAVDAGASWKPSDWAAQMLASLEAIDKLSMNCRLASVDAEKALIEFQGAVSGQRHGANTEVTIQGKLVFNRTLSLIQKASLRYGIKASIGTINPGIDATVDVLVDRSLAASPGRLTAAVAEAIPLEPPAEELLLRFDAAPWGVKLAHDRKWYVFQALLEGTPQVLILRLMEQGSLICQCNVSPIAAAAPGEHTPLERFEADIQRALGDKFKRIATRERIPSDDGRTLLRVVAEGEMKVMSDKGAVMIPTTWIYYLCAGRSGKQVSFVFVIEPAYMPLLAGRDAAMVNSLRFTP
jgi:hypothetical protein